jgi:hypothetical protein
MEVKMKKEVVIGYKMPDLVEQFRQKVKSLKPDCGGSGGNDDDDPICECGGSWGVFQD